MTTPTVLDSSHYTQGEPFMHEKTGLFAREWLPVCARSQLARPGDFLGQVIGGWPIAAVRGANQTRLFRNTCRHQSMMVLDKPAGNCSIIQCRYHGWQYQLDGAFVAAPPLVAPAESASRETIDLLELATHHAGSFLFGHLQGDAQPPRLDQAITIALERHPGAISTIDFACNWKVLVEYLVAQGLDYQWPLLAVRNIAKAAQVLQIIPRSFLRTRVVSYVMAEDEPASPVAEQAALALEQDRLACEALQPRYAQGDLAALIDSQNGASQAQRAERIHAFRGRVLEATRAL